MRVTIETGGPESCSIPRSLLIFIFSSQKLMETRKPILSLTGHTRTRDPLKNSVTLCFVVNLSL